jgi:hypothetical protein
MRMKNIIILAIFVTSVCSHAGEISIFEKLKKLFNSSNESPRISDFTKLPGNDRWVCRGASRYTEDAGDMRSINVGTTRIGNDFQGAGPLFPQQQKHKAVCVEDEHGYTECTGNKFTNHGLIISYDYYNYKKRKNVNETVTLHKVGKVIAGFQNGYNPISSMGTDGPPYYFYCYSSKLEPKETYSKDESDAIINVLTAPSVVCGCTKEGDTWVSSCPETLTCP